MKYHEYRAAGLPVVSFAIETLRDQEASDHLHIYPSERYGSMVDAVRSAIDTHPNDGNNTTKPEASVVLNEQSWDAIGVRLLELTSANV